MYYVDNNKRIVTKLENVISINSLVALVRSSHGNMVKDLTSRHNFWQFVYCQSGQCTWNIEGDLYITKKDDFIITPPKTARKYVESVEGTVMYYLSFYSNSSKLKDMQKKMVHLSPKLKHKLVSALADITDHFKKELSYLYPAEETTDLDLQRIKCELEWFLIDLYKDKFMGINSAPQTKPRESQDEYFPIALAYLQNNITSNLTISEVVKQTGIGKTTLENIFQKNEGMGIMAYFMQMKMDAAKEMLLRKNYSITDIAQELGFSSANNFSRTFKKHTGFSPKKYQMFF